MLYGSSPFSDISAHDLKLKPAMTLESELIAVRNLSIGDTIGYGSRYTVTEETKRIGVIGAGYGDGYPRVQSDNAYVLVNGKPCKILGRVCMDTMMVDLDSQPHATVGDRVELWGNGIPVDQVAKNNGAEGTIGYELLCRVGVRVKRILAEPPNKNNSMRSELTLKRAS